MPWEVDLRISTSRGVGGCYPAPLAWAIKSLAWLALREPSLVLTLLCRAPLVLPPLLLLLLLCHSLSLLLLLLLCQGLLPLELLLFSLLLR